MEIILAHVYRACMEFQVLMCKYNFCLNKYLFSSPKTLTGQTHFHYCYNIGVKSQSMTAKKKEGAYKKILDYCYVVHCSSCRKP